MEIKMKIIEKIKNIYENYYGENFVFRPFLKADTFTLMDATKYPAFNEHLAWDSPEDVATMAEQVEYLLREARMGKLLPISICEKDRGSWIGFFKFAEFREGVEMTMWYHPNYWSSLTLFNSAHAIIDTIFEHTDIEKIYLQTKVDNIKLKKLAKGNGFTFVDNTKMQHQRGHILDLEVYQVTPEQWRKLELVDPF